MSLSLRSPTARLLGAGALAVGLVLAGSAAEAQRRGPFGGLAGSWSGSGTITTKSGNSERIRCRGSYSVSNAGHTLQQSLRCASDSYRFDLSSSILHSGGSISGTFSETSRGVGGRVTGRATASNLTALVEGSGFSANVSVDTEGDRQSISISSPGAEVTRVSITLRRG